MRVGVIGTGHLGREHARIYAELPEARMVGVYDIDPEAAATAAQRAGCAVHPDRDSLLGAVDAVSVCVPTSMHVEVTTACLEAGVHVLVEKPIADDPDGARSLRDRARRHGCILQVGHVERFNPAMVAATRHLRSPRFVECHRLAPFGRRGAEVAVVLDLMIHDLDLLLAIIGGEIESIAASGVPVLTGSTDIAHARLQFRNGCVANVTASRISPERMRKVRFFQKDSYLSVDLLREEVSMVRRRPDFDLQAFQEALSRGESPDVMAAIEPVQVRVEREEPLRAELRAFLGAAARGETPLVDAEAGIRALEVACEIERLLQQEP
jgi:predicted dehydrogenase